FVELDRRDVFRPDAEMDLQNMVPRVVDQVFAELFRKARAAMLGPDIDLHHPAAMTLLESVIADEGVEADEFAIQSLGAKHRDVLQHLADFRVTALGETLGAGEESLRMIGERFHPYGPIGHQIVNAEPADGIAHLPSSMVSTLTLPLV